MGISSRLLPMVPCPVAGGDGRRLGVIALVFFDFGGVVSEFVPERRLTMLAAVSGLPKAEVQRRIWGCGLADACDVGRYSAEEMHDRVCTALGIRLPRAELRRLMCLPFR